MATNRDFKVKNGLIVGEGQGLFWGTGTSTWIAANNAAGVLGLYAGGAERIRINSTGSVSINAPASGTPLILNINDNALNTALQIVNSNVGGSAWARLDLQSGANASLVMFQAASGNSSLQTIGAHTLSLGTNNAARINIDSSGRVHTGGSTDGVSDLNVRPPGSASSSGSLSIAASSGGGGGASYLIMGNSDSGGAAGPNVIVAANRALQFGVGSSFASRSAGTFTEQMRLDGSTGHFGIGTAAPGSRLHVEASAAGSGITVGQIGQTASQVNIGVGYITAGRPFVGTNTNSNPIEIGTRLAIEAIFVTNSVERMRISAVGDVGIGGQIPVAYGSGFVNLAVGTATGGGIIDSFFAGTRAVSLFSTAGEGRLDVFGASRPLNVYVNGSQRLSITQAGVVTISTPTAGTPLVVNATATGIAQSWSDGTTSAYFGFNAGAGTAQFGTTSNHQLSFFTNSAQRMTIGASGDVTVAGAFFAATKSFLIPHPSKPGMKLRYGSLESPYHGVRLTGQASVQNGYCRVTLPDYIRDLVKDDGSQVQLTNIQHGKVLWVEQINIAEGTFDVACETTDRELKFFWSFTAVRKDVPDMIVEE
jgi:hypothetical protein